MKNCPICNRKLIASSARFECPELNEQLPSHRFEIYGFNSENETEMWEYKGYHVGRNPAKLAKLMPIVSISMSTDMGLKGNIKEYTSAVLDSDIKKFIDKLAN